MGRTFDSLDWDDLRVFLEAARAKSITRAARALNLDHSTVSRRLARLEQVVGGAVFERVRDGLRLTAVGMIVLQHGEAMTATIAGLRQTLSGEGGLDVVRIATVEGLGALYLTPRLARIDWRDEDPRIELVTTASVVRIARREADLYLSFFKPQDSQLVWDRIGTIESGLFASRAYLDRFGAPASRADLAGHRFVGFIEELVTIDAMRFLVEFHQPPALAFSSTSVVAQMYAAAGGFGLIAAPLFLAAEFPDLIRILPDALRGERQLWLTTHQDLTATPRIARIRQILIGIFRQDPQHFKP